MNMSARAQNERSPRRTSITETAVQKFRQHAPSFIGTDEKVKETLDDAVTYGFIQGAPEPYLTEEGDSAWLVDLEREVALPLFGVVKYYRDRDGRVDQSKKALVTIMKKEFVERLKATGQWNRPAPKEVVREPRKLRPVPKYVDQDGEAGLLRLITWQGAGTLCSRETSNDKVSSAVRSLIAEGISPDEIRVWRPLKLDVSIRIVD